MDCTQAWLKKLRKASFRGVPFFYESADTELGRRLARHEYPQRDIPYLEDMGRKAREMELDAYVIGGDYMRQRDALISAIEQSGAGTLVHPFLGEMQATVDSCTLSESNNYGGMARFSLRFIEAGSNEYPKTELDTQSLVETQCTAANDAMLEEFGGSFSVADAPDFVSQNALDGIAVFVDVASGLIAQMQSAVYLAQDYVDAAASALSELRLAASNSIIGDSLRLGRSVLAVVQGIGKLQNLTTFSEHRYPSLLPPPYSYNTPSRQQQRANQQALFGLVRRAAIVETVRLSAQYDFDTREQMQAKRTELADLLDGEIRSAANPQNSTFKDKSYKALIALRTQMSQDLTARGNTLARTFDVQLQQSTPALVLSYDYYEDLRDGDIVALNNAAHPLFLRGTIELLAK